MAKHNAVEDQRKRLKKKLTVSTKVKNPIVSALKARIKRRVT